MATVPVIKITAVDNASRAIRGVTQNFDKMTNRLGRSEGFLTRNRRAFQQLGFQVGDFATQVGGGQSALLAFTQQGSQMLQFFGPLGAVLAGLVAVLGSMALAITRSGLGLEDMVPLMGALTPAAEALGDALLTVKNTAIAFGDAVINNLDRIFTIAGTVASFFLIQWVAGFVAARLSVTALTATMLTLGKLLLRFLPFAVLLAVGELVFRILQLVRAAGSGAAAVELLKQLILEMATKSKFAMLGLTEAFYLAGNALRLGLLGTMNKALTVYEKFVNKSREAGAALIQAFEPDRSFASIMADFGDPFEATMVDLTNAADSTRGSMALMREMFEQAGASGLPTWQKIKDLIASLPENTRNLKAGVEEAGDSAKEAAGNLFDFVASVKSTLRSSIDSVFDALIDKSKSVGSAIRSLGLELAKLAAKQAVFKFLAAAMPGTFGSGGFLPLLKNADGNAFNNGRVTAFASGGVVSSPTTFPMRGGSGLMGEAGPEAIMPLTRVGGKLGVRSAGGGGAKTSIQIINNTPAQVRHETSQGDDGEAIQRFIIDTVGRGTARGEMDGSMGARFGQRPKRITR